MLNENINKTVTINEEAQPDILWELIKGTIRNTAIKYSTYKRKNENQIENILIKDLDELNKKAQEICNNKNNNNNNETSSSNEITEKIKTKQV